MSCGGVFIHSDRRNYAGAILMMLSIAVSLYHVSHPAIETPETSAYEYWWMSLPM